MAELTQHAITGTTSLVGLMGWPVRHSLSPTMHNAAYAALGLDFAYVPLPVQPEHVEQQDHDDVRLAPCQVRRCPRDKRPTCPADRPAEAMADGHASASPPDLRHRSGE